MVGSGSSKAVGGRSKVEDENKRLREEIAALKAAKPSSDGAVGKSDDTKAEDAEIATLRDQIKKLEGIPECSAILADKQALLADKVAAKRAAKPVDTRIRELEALVASTTRSLELKRGRVAELKAQAEEVAKLLADAVEDEQRTATKLAEVEADKVAAYSRRTREAAEAAQVELPIPLQQLDAVWGRLQPDHFHMVGCPQEKAPEVKAMLSKLLAIALQPGGARNQSGPSQPNGPQQAEAGAGMAADTGPPKGVVAAPGAIAAPSGHDEIEDPDGDEEMGDDAIAALVPTADAEALAAFKGRMREQGLWIRTARRRTTKAKPAGLVKK